MKKRRLQSSEEIELKFTIDLLYVIQLWEPPTKQNKQLHRVAKVGGIYTLQIIETLHRR
jgi:hypothetical protein